MRNVWTIFSKITFFVSSLFEWRRRSLGSADPEFGGAGPLTLTQPVIGHVPDSPPPPLRQYPQQLLPFSLVFPRPTFTRPETFLFISTNCIIKWKGIVCFHVSFNLISWKRERLFSNKGLSLSILSSLTNSWLGLIGNRQKGLFWGRSEMSWDVLTTPGVYKVASSAPPLPGRE